MIERIRIVNYRCFGDFEWKPATDDVMMLLGLNGVGKSTLLSALSVLQRMGGHIADVEQLVSIGDIAFGETNKPIRFEIDASHDGHTSQYRIAFELPPKFTKLRVQSESFTFDGRAVFDRDGANHKLPLDRHLVALPVIQSEGEDDAIANFRNLLCGMILVAPTPSSMSAVATGSVGCLRMDASNFVDWLVDAQLKYLDAYARIYQRLRDMIFPDLASYAIVRDEVDGRRVLELVFEKEGGRIVKTRFGQLSDGEKCEVLAAVVIVLAEMKACSFCYWDEPDNYLALSEVRSLVTDLRVAFRNAGVQLVMSSHNLQALDAVPYENVMLFLRDSHVEPSRLRNLTDILATPESRKYLDLQLLTGSIYDEAH